MQEPITIRAFGRELEIDRECAPVLRQESMIARRLVSDAIKAGLSITVDHGRDTEITLRRSVKVADVLKEMRATDEEALHFYRGNDPVGSVFFVYGNDGWDVINDYSTRLEWLMEKGVNALVDRLSAGA
jgi:hypothetical protein